MGYMRRCFVVPMIIVASLFAGICAFGATARGSRSIANAGAATGTTKSADTSTSSAPTGNQAVSARVANRTRVRTAPTAQQAQAVSARAAVRNTPKNVAKNVGNMNAGAGKNLKVGMGDPIMQTTSARAATKQKAVNMGTKIATATENTSIPEECQDAFYGCMDALCMLANTSGGRCRCDDRSEELDNVLDQIMKLDSQSKTLAEEGVERLQRGDAVDAIYSMAEDAANKVVADQKKNQKNFLDPESKSSSKKLDLSLFNSGVFDTDDLFGELDDDILGADLSDKKGNALRSAATKMCVSKLPSQCKEHSSMLQLVYAQKIKSDCIAYENDLKQQKMNSENLLKTAQKAVRDAAAEAYASKNKYKTTGECVIAFKQCMLGEEVCGSGFSKCVIDPTLISKNTSKSYTIKTSKNVTVEITASTYGALEGNRSFCDNVLAQCVDANKNDAVWKQFLLNVAPELRAAEFNAEDESRRNCARNVVSCIKEVAANEGLQEGSDSWYLFTSNDTNIEYYCKGALDKCDAYGDGVMSGSVKAFVKLSLNALRADRCTATIKKCLQDSCGEDYSGCLGYTVGDLRDFCPQDVIMVDCSGKENEIAYNGDIYKYVDSVAQGLFLNVDDALVRGCMNAVNTAMTTYCGDTASCSGGNLDFSDVVNKYLTYKLFGGCNAQGKNCAVSKDSISEFSSSDVLYCPKWVAKVNYGGLSDFFNKVSVVSGSSQIPLSIPDGLAKKSFVGESRFQGKEDSTTNISSVSGLSSDFAFKANDDENKAINAVVDKMNSAYKNLISLIESDYNVSKCINGTTRGSLANGSEGAKTQGQTSKAFQNLTNNIKSIVAQSIYDNFSAQFSARVEELQPDIDAANAQIDKVYADAEKVCEAGDVSNGTGSGTAEANGRCEMGNCGACNTAEKKCNCIARTYFQHGPVKMEGNKYGEYTWLLDINATYKDGFCSFAYNRVQDCGDYTKRTDKKYFSFCYYGDGTVKDANEVKFALADDTPISISECTLSDNPSDKGDLRYQDVLDIGGQRIEFKHCTKDNTKQLEWKTGTLGDTIDNVQQRADRGEGACYWCFLGNLRNSPVANGTYIKGTNSTATMGTNNEKKDNLYRYFNESDYPDKPESEENPS